MGSRPLLIRVVDCSSTWSCGSEERRTLSPSLACSLPVIKTILFFSGRTSSLGPLLPRDAFVPHINHDPRRNSTFFPAGRSHQGFVAARPGQSLSRLPLAVVKSMLQKNVRRGRAEGAVRCALELALRSWSDAIRRYLIFLFRLCCFISYPWAICAHRSLPLRLSQAVYGSSRAVFDTASPLRYARGKLA